MYHLHWSWVDVVVGEGVGHDAGAGGQVSRSCDQPVVAVQVTTRTTPPSPVRSLITQRCTHPRLLLAREVVMHIRTV